jgi:GNAT superfamily N-acetyltransferase
MDTPPHKPVWMIRENLEDLPAYSLPQPFSFRWYKSGDQKVWEEIQKQCEHDPRPFPTDLFDRAFGADQPALAQRQCYLLDELGDPIGTATAWLDEDFGGKRYGRIHYVAIAQRHQRRGLAKPLMSLVCSRLRELGHERACLRTSTHRLVAINLYLKFGFLPLIRNTEEQRDWDAVLNILR